MVSLKNLELVVVILSATLILAGCTGRTILLEDRCPPASGIKPVDGGIACKESVPSHRDHKICVWFVRPSGSQLKLVGVDREINSNADAMSEAITCLLHGPEQSEKDNGLGTEIPGGTILLGVSNANDEIELNLSQRFSSGGEDTSLETRIEQLRRTVDPIADGKKVFLDIEGNRLSATSGEGLEVNQPIN